jgi:hypothetical protein
MNKLFAVTLIAGASQALDINIHANSRSFSEADLLDLASEEGVIFDNDDQLWIGPAFETQPQTSLAQTS